MSAYIIPAAATVFTWLQTSQSTQESLKKYHLLQKRVNTLAIHMKQHWEPNIDSFARLTTIALGAQPSKPLTQESAHSWVDSMVSQRNTFEANYNPRNSQKKNNWVMNLWVVSVIAQALVCYKRPLSLFSRVASLTASIALPLFFFFREHNAQQLYRQSYKYVSRFTSSYPIMTGDQFNRFVFKGVSYQNQKATSFDATEIHSIKEALLHDHKQPENLVSTSTGEV